MKPQASSILLKELTATWHAEMATACFLCLLRINLPRWWKTWQQIPLYKKRKCFLLECFKSQIETELNQHRAGELVTLLVFFYFYIKTTFGFLRYQIYKQGEANYDDMA
jgi:hypothetical protein